MTDIFWLDTTQIISLLITEKVPTLPTCTLAVFQDGRPSFIVIKERR